MHTCSAFCTAGAFPRNVLPLQETGPILAPEPLLAAFTGYMLSDASGSPGWSLQDQILLIGQTQAFPSPIRKTTAIVKYSG